MSVCDVSQESGLCCNRRLAPLMNAGLIACTVSALHERDRGHLKPSKTSPSHHKPAVRQMAQCTRGHARSRDKMHVTICTAARERQSSPVHISAVSHERASRRHFVTRRLGKGGQGLAATVHQRSARRIKAMLQEGSSVRATDQAEMRLLVAQWYQAMSFDAATVQGWDHMIAQRGSRTSRRGGRIRTCPRNMG